MFNLISILNWVAYLPTASVFAEASIVAANNKRKKDLDLSFIPGMIKRRCSQASKIALSVALEAATLPVDYAIFCSQHGEIGHTVALLEAITQQEMLSPSSFSQSVHNTASGLFTIIQNNTIPVTSIAAGKTTFLAGMIEALVWLQQNSEKTILLVMFEEAMPEPYVSLPTVATQEYGIALLLSNKSSDFPLLKADISTDSTISEVEVMPSAVKFLNWYLENQQQPLMQYMPGCAIRWEIQHV